MQKLDYRLECLYDFVKHNKNFTLKQVSDKLLLSEAHLLKLIKVLAVKNNMNIYREKKDNEIFYSLYENQVLKNQKLKEIRKVFKTNFESFLSDLKINNSDVFNDMVCEFLIVDGVVSMMIKNQEVRV